MHGKVYVVGTCDTKGDELRFVTGLLREAGIPVLLVDIGIRSDGGGADVAPREVAAHHPEGAGAVLVDDRGRAVRGMGQALLRFVAGRDDIAAMIGLGGSGGTSMIAPAMQTLPIGLPKVMVSAVAASDIRPYVGLSDIVMIPSVTDIDRVNRISRTILANAALFAALERHLDHTPARRLVVLPYHVNDAEFADALVEHFLDIAG